MLKCEAIAHLQDMLFDANLTKQQTEALRETIIALNSTIAIVQFADGTEIISKHPYLSVRITGPEMLL